MTTTPCEHAWWPQSDGSSWCSRCGAKLTYTIRPRATLASSPPGAVGGTDKKPCGECHLHAGETCDICGAKEPALSPAAPSSEIAGLDMPLNYDELADAYSRQIEHTNRVRAAYQERVATLTARLAEAERDAERLRQGMQFIWDALDNDDEAEAFRMADEMRRASRSTGETRP